VSEDVVLLFLSAHNANLVVDCFILEWQTHDTFAFFFVFFLLFLLLPTENRAGATEKGGKVERVKVSRWLEGFWREQKQNIFDNYAKVLSLLTRFCSFGFWLDTSKPFFLHKASPWGELTRSTSSPSPV
jgi:hypothetical protein